MPRPRSPRRPDLHRRVPAGSDAAHRRQDRRRPLPQLRRARRSRTWFKNAHTTYDSTTRAIPQVMDGKLPRKSSTPDFVGHPNTIFTIFGRHGYRVASSEEATSVCPPRYCNGARRGRPGILQLLQNGRRERFERFFPAIKAGKPTLYLKHALLPHGPYLFLPSGKQTRRRLQDPMPGHEQPGGVRRPRLTDHNRQRVPLQIGFADREIGQLFARMKPEGTFDHTADRDHRRPRHRVRGRRQGPPHRDPRATSTRSPPCRSSSRRRARRRGRHRSAYVRTVDVVPTIADLLNFKMPYRADGRSAFSRAVKRPPRRAPDQARLQRHDRRLRPAMERRRAPWGAPSRKFGEGDLASLYTGIGPDRRLLGPQAAPLRPQPRARCGRRSSRRTTCASVNPSWWSSRPRWRAR